MTNKFTEKKSNKTIAQLNKTQKINNNGEVEEEIIETISKIYSASEPSYIKAYQQDFLPVNSLKKCTKEILQEILVYTKFNENTIVLNQSIKVNICHKLGIAYQTLANALTELKKHQLLLYISTGQYIVNPFYFSKGEWKEIKKIRDKIKVTERISFNNDKKVVMESAKKILLDFLNWLLVTKLFDIIEITNILKHSKRMKLAPSIYTYT